MDRVIVTAQMRPLISYDEAENTNVTHLNFVCDKGKGKNKKRSFWQVTPNGNYGNECLIGRSYALEALQYMVDKNYTLLLTDIILGMRKQEQHSGIEIGFISTLAEFAVIGAIANAERLKP